jgi:hypothetical protein
MSISGVTSASSSYVNPYAQVKQDFKSLGTALQSGNLSDAQQAFAALQQDNPNIGQSQGGSTQGGQNSSQANQAFQNLSSALQSGDLSGAQQAFAQLQQGMQGAGKGHGHHHHHHQQQAGQQSDISSTSTNLTITIQEVTYSSQGTIGANTSEGTSSAPNTASVSVLS